MELAAVIDPIIAKLIIKLTVGAAIFGGSFFLNRSSAWIRVPLFFAGMLLTLGWAYCIWWYIFVMPETNALLYSWGIR